MTDVTLDDNPVAALPLTGDEILAGIQDDADVQMTVDDILAPAVRVSGNQTIEGTKSFAAPVIVPTPTAANHAVPRSFVDALALGGAASSGAVAPVKVVSTSPQNIGLASGLPVIDGYQTVENDRVLLTGQTSAVDDGPWVARGALGWVRPDDFAVGTSQAGMAVFVAGGNTYKGSVWVLNSTGTVLVGTNAQTWAQDATAVRLTGNQTIGGTKTFSNAPLVPDNSWSISDTAGLVAALAGKADDNDVVHDTGNEPIDGVKTFSSSPVVPTATTSGQAVNKGQLDTAVGGIAGTILAAAGGTDDTAAVVAGRTAAGIGGTLVFTSGTYVVYALAASVANQHWIIRPGAVLKLKNGSNTPVIDVTASGVTIDGGGTIDGNKANQSATTLGDVTGGPTAGVRAVGVTGCTVESLLVKDCGTQSIYTSNSSVIRIRNNRLVNCGPAGNSKSVIVYDYYGVVTDVEIAGNTVDCTTSTNGCIAVAMYSTVARDIRIHDNLLIVGNATVTPTLGVELFTSELSPGTGGSIRDVVIANNVVRGAGTPASTDQIYGISVGGVAPDATDGDANIVVSGNVIRGCPSHSVEVIGTSIAVTSNTITDSGPIAVYATEVDGGIHDVSITANTIFGSTLTGFAVLMEGDTNGIFGLVVANNTIRNPAGQSFATSGTITGLVLTANTVTEGQGAAVLVQGTLTDSTISANHFELTTATAGTHGIYLSSATIARIRIDGNVIKGATGTGIYGLPALSDIDITNNTIMDCDNGIRADSAATRWTVSGNRVTGCTSYGIGFAVASTDLLVHGNRSYSNATADYYFAPGTTFADFVVNDQVVALP